MLRPLLSLPRVTLLSAIVIATPAMAGGLKPSQEFLEYLADYGDENGDVMDPLELDEVLNMKDDAATQDQTLNKPNIRNTDMKTEQTSSVQDSSKPSSLPASASAKGAKL